MGADATCLSNGDLSTLQYLCRPILQELNFPEFTACQTAQPKLVVGRGPHKGQLSSGRCGLTRREWIIKTGSLVREGGGAVDSAHVTLPSVLLRSASQ